jgi:hypothetical protein
MEGPAHSAIQPGNAPFARTMERHKADQLNHRGLKQATKQGLFKFKKE